MSVDNLITSWKEIREGFIDEVTQIPESQFGFRATSETRSIVEVLRHVVESQKLLVGECCRAEPNFLRQSFADHIKEYAPGVTEVTEKDRIIELMRRSMDDAEATLRAHADKIRDEIHSFDGSLTTKLGFMQFATSHEMYHRGQFTVYARLLNIEPALTKRMKRLFAQAG